MTGKLRLAGDFDLVESLRAQSEVGSTQTTEPFSVEKSPGEIMATLPMTLLQKLISQPLPFVLRVASFLFRGIPVRISAFPREPQQASLAFDRV